MRISAKALAKGRYEKLDKMAAQNFLTFRKLLKLNFTLYFQGFGNNKVSSVSVCCFMMDPFGTSVI